MTIGATLPPSEPDVLLQSEESRTGRAERLNLNRNDVLMASASRH
jgi:hypothetical protein